MHYGDPQEMAYTVALLISKSKKTLKLFLFHSDILVYGSISCFINDLLATYDVHHSFHINCMKFVIKALAEKVITFLLPLANGEEIQHIPV